jgi:hypothetical protein
MMTVRTSGVIFIHSASSALRPHIDWAVSAACGAPIRLSWTRQPADPALWRAERRWHGVAGTSAIITSELKRCTQARYEVTEEPTATTEGMRYTYTPRLGLFSGRIGPSGDIVVPEERLRAALDRHRSSRRDREARASLETELAYLIGEPWDDELEIFRYAGDVEPTPWLRQVG